MKIRTLYRIVVIGTFWYLGASFGVNLVLSIGHFDAVKIVETCPNYIWLPFAMLSGLLSIGLMVLWVGMIMDCISVSQLRIWSKLLWIILLIPTSAIGALIYYFCVYRRQPIVDQEGRPKPTAA